MNTKKKTPHPHSTPSHDKKYSLSEKHTGHSKPRLLLQDTVLHSALSDASAKGTEEEACLDRHPSA